MLLVSNPSVNKIDIVPSAGRVLTIKPKADNQELNVSGAEAESIKKNLLKHHPYLKVSVVGDEQEPAPAVVPEPEPVVVDPEQSVPDEAAEPEQPKTTTTVSKRVR